MEGGCEGLREYARGTASSSSSVGMKAATSVVRQSSIFSVGGVFKEQESMTSEVFVEGMMQGITSGFPRTSAQLSCLSSISTSSATSLSGSTTNRDQMVSTKSGSMAMHNFGSGRTTSGIFQETTSSSTTTVSSLLSLAAASNTSKTVLHADWTSPATFVPSFDQAHKHFANAWPRQTSDFEF